MSRRYDHHWRKPVTARSKDRGDRRLRSGKRPVAAAVPTVPEAEAEVRESYLAAETLLVRAGITMPERARCFDSANRLALAYQDRGMKEEAAKVCRFAVALTGLRLARNAASKPPTPCQATLPVVVTAADVRAARDAMERAGVEAGRYGEEIIPLLKSNGMPNPRDWTQKDLRRLMATFRAEGDIHECFAVERYAESRILWAKAIDAYKEAQRLAVSGPSLPAASAPPAVPLKRDTVGFGMCSYGWVGLKTLPPPKPWHAAVPPWEDGPS